MHFFFQFYFTDFGEIRFFSSHIPGLPGLLRTLSLPVMTSMISLRLSGVAFTKPSIRPCASALAIGPRANCHPRKEWRRHSQRGSVT